MNKLIILTLLFCNIISCQSNPEESLIMNEKHKPNRLINEKSPYLLQHAYNPVEWYPWGDEAFEKARSEDKPVFLSIGYSTCHWCHVMERESFEDSSVAAMMNEVFVSIKVDREERPDIDNIYMAVCQAMTGHGGWPLTIIMTADKEPFYAGTYFPKESRMGRIGLIDLINGIKNAWKNKRDEIENTADQVTNFLRESIADTPGDELEVSILTSAYQMFVDRFDNKHGGFSSTPKFPSPHNLLYLLRYWKRTGETKALNMVEKTLQEMRKGGMFDHIGFGFHRYSTDSKWFLPHFEKMLYDQAMHSMTYVEAFQATGKEEYKKTAEEIFEYVLRDMTSPEGGFYSAEDADSEGVEGKFYVWSTKEIKEILDEKDAKLFLKIFNFEEDGNFEEEATKQKTGENIPHLKKSFEDMANELQKSDSELYEWFIKIRKTLFDVREKRVHPLKDDKILTDWNGLMIAALAKGAAAFNNPNYSDAAEKAVNFILQNLSEDRGRLLHRYREGEAALQANANDYAFIIWGLLELYETTFNPSYLETAVKLNNIFIEHFWDELSGGFFFTPDDGENLLVRTKEIYDGAIPSANSVAVLNLLRLGRLISNSELETMASNIFKLYSEGINKSPIAFTNILSAADFGFGPSFEIVIVGNPDSDDTKAMLDELAKQYLPNKVVVLIPSGKKDNILKIATFAKDYEATDGKATAYVCQNYVCNFPTTDLNQMIKLLNKK